MKKRFFVILVSMLMIVSLALMACGSKENPQPESTSQDTQSRTIVDMKGNSIQLDGDVNTYIVLWKSYTGVMAMLDKCEGLVGCDYDVNSDRDAWLFELCPAAKDITIVTEEITAEEVANLNVDVVFWQNSNCEELAQQCISLGIPAVNISFTDYETMKQSVEIAAEVLGTDSAKEKAKAFNAYLDQSITQIQEVSQTIPEEEKVRVVNLRNVKELRADGKGTVADTWIECIGAINVVSEHELEGNQYLEVEQLYEWDPDIVVSSVYEDDKTMYSDERFSTLSAVQNQRVYINPNGIFYWNRYSVETPLQLYWAAVNFYPERFQNISINEQVKAFYNQFFGYDISDENINQMLEGLPPLN